MKMFNKENKETGFEMMIIEKWGAVFTTIDGERHNLCKHKWITKQNNELKDDVPSFLYERKKEQGFIEDDNLTYYPIRNVLKIEWKLLGEKKVVDNRGEFKIRWKYSDSELKKLTVLSETDYEKEEEDKTDIKKEEDKTDIKEVFSLHPGDKVESTKDGTYAIILDTTDYKEFAVYTENGCFEYWNFHNFIKTGEKVELPKF